MGKYTIFYLFENPRRGMEARNFTTNVLKILDLKSSSEQIFFRKLSLGAPDCQVKINLWSGGLSSLFVSRYPRKKKTPDRKLSFEMLERFPNFDIESNFAFLQCM